MRIALLTSEYPGLNGWSGGLAAYTQRTARALHALGHDVTVLAPGPADAVQTDGGVPLIAVATNGPAWLMACDRITLRRCAVPISLMHASMRLEQRMRDLHRQRPFDVIHYAGINGLGLFRGAIPAVARASCHRRTWTALGDGTHPGWHSWLHEQIENMALRRMDRLFAPSRPIAQRISEDLGRTVAVLPNPWIAPDGPPGALPPRLSGTNFVLFAGTASRIKGILTLASAMRTLMAEDPALQLVIAGRQTEEGRSACAGLDGRTIDLGLLERSQLRAVMRAAAVVVVPSLADNLPNAALEALAEGAVVVASAGIGLEDVDDGQGLAACVPPGDACALTGAIRQALRLDASGRDRVSQRARRAIATLEPARTIPPLLALYRDAIAGDGRP